MEGNSGTIVYWEQLGEGVKVFCIINMPHPLLHST